MSLKINIALLVVAALVAQSAARPTFPSRLPNGANVAGVTAIGHVDPAGGGARNAFGEAFEANGLKWSKELCMLDSDGDGQTNGEELGDPCCEWVKGTNEKLVWTTGVSAPGDATSKSDPALLKTAKCGGASNTTAPSKDTTPTPVPSTTSAAVGSTSVAALALAASATAAIAAIVAIPSLNAPFRADRGTINKVRSGSATRIHLPGRRFNRIHVDDIPNMFEESAQKPGPGAIYNADEVTAYACELLGLPVGPLQTWQEAKNSMSAMAKTFYADHRIRPLPTANPR